MKNKNEFHGWFADEFRLFLQEKHTLGIKYTDEERMLYQIDAMTLDYDCQHGFPRLLVEEFIRFRPHWAKGTQESRINLIRQMALFLIKMGVPSYYPDSCWKGNSTRDFHPYIYTHEEMVRLFAVADNPGKRISERSRDFHSVIYRLLYSSGLRVSEALNLTMGDIDFVEGTIYIRNSKNHKDRKLPIDKGMLAWIEGYASKYHKTYRPEDYFFRSPDGGAYSKYTVYGYFRKMLFACGISHGGRKKGGPRLHDARHAFCVHSLEKMLSQGIPYDAALPVLCAYMGHSSLSATTKYLHLTQELYPEISQRLERATGGVIPDMEGIGNENE